MRKKGHIRYTGSAVAVAVTGREAHRRQTNRVGLPIPPIIIIPPPTPLSLSSPPSPSLRRHIPLSKPPRSKDASAGKTTNQGTAQLPTIAMQDRKLFDPRGNTNKKAAPPDRAPGPGMYIGNIVFRRRRQGGFLNKSLLPFGVSVVRSSLGGRVRRKGRGGRCSRWKGRWKGEEWRGGSSRRRGERRAVGSKGLEAQRLAAGRNALGKMTWRMIVSVRELGRRYG